MLFSNLDRKTIKFLAELFWVAETFLVAEPMWSRDSGNVLGEEVILGGGNIFDGSSGGINNFNI